jgi:FkbH-like protein
MTVVDAPAADAAEVLRDPTAPLAAILRTVRELEAADPGRPRMRVGLSANVTVDLLATFVRRHALLHDVVAEVHQGSLDAHLENVRAFADAGVEHLFVLDVLDALAPSFEAQVPTLTDDQLDAHVARVRDLLTVVLAEAEGRFRSIDVARFHRLSAPTATPASAAVDAAVDALNAALDEVVAAAPGVRTLAVGDALDTVGRADGVDPRFALRFRAPYTARTCDQIARRLLLATRAGGRYLYKALVLDCDGTLWGGVVGEDGIDGIALDPHSYPGNAYWAAQHAFLALQRAGALLCLASKNEPADVEEALTRHPAMVIRPDDVVVRKVSWDDKVASLEAIADELDIGLDSLVFVDDSPFEIEAVRARLPEVTTFLVPLEPWAYPALAREIGELFTAGPLADSGTGKTEQYRIRAAGLAERGRHATEADYLRSLELCVELRTDERAALARLAELTQKTNQFNLTTHRCTADEVAAAIDADDAAVLSLHVRDRFGDHGLVGLLIARFDAPVAEVETFLMSCRVIGRGIERSCWARLAELARARGCTELHAEYRATAKNAQVARFYDALGLNRTEETAMRIRYAAELAAIDQSVPDHLTVHVA